jgi:protein-disulfide isomerase
MGVTMRMMKRSGAVAAGLLLLADALPGAGHDLPLGMIGGQAVYEPDLVKADPDAFRRLEQARDQQIRGAEMQFAQARHDLLAKELDARLDRRALELEAAARHFKPESLLSDIKVPVVTDEEARAFYEARRDRTSQPYETLASAIKQYLASQHNDAATRTFYDQLRAEHGIKSLLGPYRVNVAATGPVRGDKSAPVTILEFGDFQCPYCREEEPVLRSLVREHPGEVKVVFRFLPLVNVHPDAEVAAEAAVCAERQGKFWEMHDAMFEHQDQLKPDALTATAARLGLDKDRFAECLRDKDVQKTIQADVQAAADLGVDNTPYFFINGRPVLGDIPKDQLERMIGEELTALKKGSG